MSVPEVCELLGCKRSRVFQLLAAGILERAPRWGRQIRIYRDTVEAALKRPERSRPAQRYKRRGPAPERFDLKSIPIKF